MSGTETFLPLPCFVCWKETREIDVNTRHLRNTWRGLDRGPIAAVIAVYSVAFAIAALTMNSGFLVA
jgi:hypothetical protein